MILVRSGQLPVRFVAFLDILSDRIAMLICSILVTSFINVFFVWNYWLQAKSPIRTLDELTVTEVAPSPHFPTVLERKQSDNGMEVSFPSSDKPEANSLDPIQDIGQGFGIRRRHRCFVVTARARSFLYHQVTFFINFCPRQFLLDYMHGSYAKIYEILENLC